MNEILTVTISIEENQDLKLASAASEEVHLLPEDPTKVINIVFIPMKTTWITLPKGKVILRSKVEVPLDQCHNQYMYGF